MLVIELPQKIWQKKVDCQFRMPVYDDVDDGVFEFKSYGKCVFRPNATWDAGSRSDLIVFNEMEDSQELQKDLRIGTHASTASKARIIDIIKKYWDTFCEKGCHRTIIGYEFSIDTGDHTPVCCRKPSYGFHESKIIMEQIKALLANKWIRKCGGPWGSLIVLAAKPHQEHVIDIDDFVWRMCVSYRALNRITKPFQFPIPRCDDSIYMLGNGSVLIFLITLDARQGYHQVGVKVSDQDKLAFFGPDDYKYCYTVMPFGPTNAPTFYTAMMRNFKQEWDLLFIERVRELKQVAGKMIVVSSDGTILVDGQQIISGSRSIIDDIMLWCCHEELVILYFECVCMVFQKYRVSFKLSKCEFLSDRVEYVGHDVLKDGNTPARSKFDLIRDWKLPTTGQSLFSFIGLICFYHKFVPYLEIRLKPLRALLRKFYRKPIPQVAWTPERIELFENMKLCITSSPITIRYDPNMPVFLKTDWSSCGMGWILMQPAQDKMSKDAVNLLETKGECLFDMSPNGARLKPIAFGSRSCTAVESKLHSFTGEAACGRWAIAQNKRFLWGKHFYWLCDCAAIKEILDYSGSIAMICRWAQELLGYHFSVVHRPSKMMQDVDALSRNHYSLVSQHLMIAAYLHHHDSDQRPLAYDKDNLETYTTSRKLKDKPASKAVAVLTTSFLTKLATTTAVTNTGVLTCPSCPMLDSVPILLTAAPPSSSDAMSDTMSNSDAAILTSTSIWLCIDDIIGSSYSLFQSAQIYSTFWDIQNAFTNKDIYAIFHQLLQPTSAHIVDITTMHDTIKNIDKISIAEVTYHPFNDYSFIQWVEHCAKFVANVIRISSLFQLGILWMRDSTLPMALWPHCRDILMKYLPSNWHVTRGSVRSPSCGDAINAYVVSIIVAKVECQSSDACPLLDPTTDIPSIHDAISFHTPDPSSIATIAVKNEEDNAIWFDNIDTHPRVLAVLLCNGQRLQCSHSSNYILDPGFPMMEPAPQESSTEYFGRRAGLCRGDTNGAFIIGRSISNIELLLCYSIPYTMIPLQLDHTTYDDLLDDCLPHSVPWQTKNKLASAYINWCDILNLHYLSSGEHVDHMQCYITRSQNDTLDWTMEYDRDKSTKTMLSLLQGLDPPLPDINDSFLVPSCLTSSPSSQQFCNIPSPLFNISQLTDVDVVYHRALNEGRIRILHGKLVLYKTIFKDKRYLCLIIVPQGLRRKIFAHYHAGPSGGHMGEYKTLFRIRSRFFWPRLRQCIKDWVKSCAHCVAYDVWRTRQSELYFSWPVTSPFYIMHCDLWQPGMLCTSKLGTAYAFNCMCDITQFVVSSCVYDPDAAILARTFMENVVLAYGMVAVLVVDADTKFRGVFEELCGILKITLWPLARGNHKGNSVERYHRFLNKTQTICGNDRGTHESFVTNLKTSQYAWNASPIDGTDIARCIPAVGREFKFPMDIELQPSPTLNDDCNSALLTYLRHVSCDTKFAESILQILIEERREYHRHRANDTKTATKFKVGDVVKAHVAVTSNAAKNVVKKLSYQAKGPFIVVEDLGHDSYSVRRYNKPDSATRKYKSHDLFLLPPFLFPHEEVDTMDVRYLNYSHAPVPSPLQRPLNIELYNDVYFPAHPDIIDTTTDTPSTAIDAAAFREHVVDYDSTPASTIPLPPSPPASPPPKPSSPPSPISSPSSPTLHESIIASRDKLFFVKYTPERTLRPRWYPVAVDLENTLRACPLFADDFTYWCVFQARHPNDSNLSDEFARWWPEWHEYHRDSKTNVTVFDGRVLFPPHRVPDSSKYIEWAMPVTLSGPQTCALLGPFDFEQCGAPNRVRRKIHRAQWTELVAICLDVGLLPPTLGASTSHIPLRHRVHKKRT